MEQQSALQDLKNLLVNAPSLLSVYDTLEPMLLKLFKAQRMSIFQRRMQHQDLVARFKTGNEVQEIKVPISPHSIAGYVALSQIPLIINDPYSSDELSAIHPRLKFADKFDKHSTFRTQNLICIPILNAGVLMGIMQIINKNDGAFQSADLALANKVAQTLGNKFRYELGGTSQPFDYLVHRKVIDETTL